MDTGKSGGSLRDAAVFSVSVLAEKDGHYSFRKKVWNNMCK